MEVLVGLIALNAVVLIILGWMVVGRSKGTDVTSLNLTLADLRSRLDSLATTQADLPRVLADSRADQAADVSQQLASFARVVAGHIDAGQEHVGRRLTDAGELISDVRERLGELSVSAKRIEELGTGVNEVHELLRVPKLRGTVGEVWLEEMLHQILPSAMYETQYVFPTGERVDAVVRLGGRLLCVDAKFPLDACQRMLAANGTAEATERHRRAFCRSVRTRVDEVADKYIRPGDGTFEFALMYIPAERVYYEAVSANGENLIGYALTRQVVLVSPNTLYAYLSAMLHGLRGFHVQRNAREVADLISALRSTVSQLVRVHETVGRHLDNAMKQHGEAARHVQRMDKQLAEVPGVAPGRGPRSSRPFVGPPDRTHDSG